MRENKIKIHSLNEREWVRRRRGNRCKGEEIREKEGDGDGEEEGEVKMKEETKRGGRRIQGGDFTSKSDRPLRQLRAISLALIQQHNINNLCTGLALLCILNVFCSINNYQALNKCQGLFILLFPMITFIIHESYKVSVTRSILKISNLRFQEVK